MKMAINNRSILALVIVHSAFNRCVCVCICLLDWSSSEKIKIVSRRRVIRTVEDFEYTNNSKSIQQRARAHLTSTIQTNQFIKCHNIALNTASIYTIRIGSIHRFNESERIRIAKQPIRSRFISFSAKCGYYSNYVISELNFID